MLSRWPQQFPIAAPNSPHAHGKKFVGLLQLVGSLKTYVPFAKEPYTQDLYSSKENYIFAACAPARIYTKH